MELTNNPWCWHYVIATQVNYRADPTILPAAPAGSVRSRRGLVIWQNCSGKSRIISQRWSSCRRRLVLQLCFLGLQPLPLSERAYTASTIKRIVGERFTFKR